MPIPRVIARFNLVVTNPILRHVAWWAPGFAMVTHVGRSSGVVRHTPVNIFKHGTGFVIALTYGRGSEWVRNVEAAGECIAQMRGRRVRLVHPVVAHDPSGRMVPGLVRIILRLIDVTDFLLLDVASEARP